MIKLMQAELYRIRKNRLFLISIILSTFFMLAFSTSFHYSKVKIPLAAGKDIVISLNEFTEFLFSDYSLVIPITIFLVAFFIEDYEKGLPEIALSKGITRVNFLFGKIITSCELVVIYLLFNIFMAYLFFVPFILNRYVIEYFLIELIGYVFLQALCFVGYTCFLWLVCYTIRNRFFVSVFLLML